MQIGANMNNDGVTDVVFINENGEEYSKPEKDRPKTSYETKFEDFLASATMSSAAMLSIYKYRGRTYNDGLNLIDKFPVDKFSDVDGVVLYLREHWGAGDYRLIVREGNKPVVNQHLEVLGENTKNQNTEKPSEINGVLTQMMNQMRELQNQVIEISRNNSRQESSRKDFYEEMLIMKQVFGNQNQVDPMAQLQSTMSVLQNMGVQIGGQTIEHEEKGFGDLIEKMTPLMEVALNSQMNNKTYQQNPIDPKKAQYMKWKQGISFLINGAKASADPAMYAELVIGQVGSSNVEMFLKGGDAGIAKLKQMFPETANHIEWFKLLFEHLKAQMGMPSAVDGEYEDLTSNVVSSNDNETFDHATHNSDASDTTS